MVTGDVWVDGSLLYGKYKALRRAGWAFASVAPDGTFQHAAYGSLPLPPHRHVILAAELWAVYMVLCVAAPPLRIYTDCLTVLKGIQYGAEWATLPNRRHSDI